MSDVRALPRATPETQSFWNGVAERKLLLQRCTQEMCGTVYFPPQPFCPACLSKAVDSVEASGRASLYSYIISHLPAPGFVPPYVIAVVQLEDGPRLLTNIVNCAAEPEALLLDMPLQLSFVEAAKDALLPVFEPATGAGR